MARMRICHSCQQTYSDDTEFCPHDGTQLTVQATESEVQFGAGLSRRFRIVCRVGSGDMGAVFLAKRWRGDTKLNAYVNGKDSQSRDSRDTQKESEDQQCQNSTMGLAPNS